MTYWILGKYYDVRYVERGDRITYEAFPKGSMVIDSALVRFDPRARWH